MVVVLWVMMFCSFFFVAAQKNARKPCMARMGRRPHKTYLDGDAVGELDADFLGLVGGVLGVHRLVCLMG